MKNILHLNLDRRPFYDIATEMKHIEYRKCTRYWKTRLEDRDYDAIKFRNGYATKAPEMLVTFRGLRKRRQRYEVLLGRILQIKRWKPPKPAKHQISRARKYIDSMDWKFSRSMPQWPHYYIVRKWGSPREFDFVDGLIEDFGYPDIWGNRTNYYLTIDTFKYWIDDDVLNRAAPISNAKVIRRGARYCARHGRKIGPWED